MTKKRWKNLALLTSITTITGSIMSLVACNNSTTNKDALILLKNNYDIKIDSGKDNVENSVIVNKIYEFFLMEIKALGEDYKHIVNTDLNFVIKNKNDTNLDKNYDLKTKPEFNVTISLLKTLINKKLNGQKSVLVRVINSNNL